MFGSSGANELGYAACAVLMATVETLIKKNLLSVEDSKAILKRADALMEPTSNISSVNGARALLGNFTFT